MQNKSNTKFNANKLNLIKKIILYSLILLFILILIGNFIFEIITFEIIETFLEPFGSYSMIIFALLYIIITLFGFSAVVFTVLAGTLFGIGWGLVIVVIAATLASGIAFYIARYFSTIFFKGEIKNQALHNLIEKIEKNCDKNGFTTIVILRLSFMPYIPLSYAAGLVKTLKFRDFILATFITNIFGSFVFIVLGASITKSWYVFVGAIMLVLLFTQFPKLIKKYSKLK
ncbi:MAG: VTT domain-containing protein [Nanoarchaeota archaeon]|nr:VTT domain-containing protein [Nanoarchaeota archaeon]